MMIIQYETNSKMNTVTPMNKKFLLPMLLSVLTIILPACDSQNNGETHWMQQCSDEDTCGEGLDCLCGVCTKSCDNTEQMVCGGAPEKSICISNKLKEGLGCTIETAASRSGTALCLPDCDGGCAGDSKCVDGACVPSFLLDAAPSPDLANSADDALSTIPISDTDNALLKRGYKSGSRLKAIMIARKDLKDSDGVFKRFYDTQLEVECQFELTRDGKYHCMPFLVNTASQPSNMKLSSGDLPDGLTPSLLRVYPESPYFEDAECEGVSVGMVISKDEQLFENCPEQSYSKLLYTYQSVKVETTPTQKKYFHLDDSVDPPACVSGLLSEDVGKQIYPIQMNPSLSEYVEATPSIIDVGSQSNGLPIAATVLSGVDDSAVVYSMYSPETGECGIGHLSDESGFEWYDIESRKKESYCIPSSALFASDESPSYFPDEGCEGAAFELGSRYNFWQERAQVVPLHAVVRSKKIYEVKDIERAGNLVYKKDAGGNCITLDYKALFAGLPGYSHYYFRRGEEVTTGFDEVEVSLESRGGLILPMLEASNGVKLPFPQRSAAFFGYLDSVVLDTSEQIAASRNTDETDDLGLRECTFYFSRTAGESYCLAEFGEAALGVSSAYFSDSACTAAIVLSSKRTPKPARSLIIEEHSVRGGCDTYWESHGLATDIVAVGDLHAAEIVYRWADKTKTSCEAVDVDDDQQYYIVGPSVADTVPRFVETVDR